MYTHEVHTASWLTYKAVNRSALITTTRIQVHIAHMLTGMWEYMHWMTSCLHLHTNPKTHISGTVHVVTSSTLLLNWGNYLYVQCTSNILSCQCEFVEPVSKDKLTTIGVVPNNAIIAMYVWIHNNWDVLYNADIMYSVPAGSELRDVKWWHLVLLVSIDCFMEWWYSHDHWPLDCYSRLFIGSAWVEYYKVTQKKMTQKSKALRKAL